MAKLTFELLDKGIGCSEFTRYSELEKFVNFGQSLVMLNSSIVHKPEHIKSLPMLVRKLINI